jgi:tetrahydromethanopterin S-methyltransferase subunit G
MLHEQAAQPTEDSKEEPGAEISSEEADRLRARLVELEEQLKSAESEHRQEVQRIH